MNLNDKINAFKSSGSAEPILIRTDESTLGLIAKDMISISRTEYDRLVEDSRQLAILDDLGVDNWESNHLRYMSDQEYNRYCEGSWG